MNYETLIVGAGPAGLSAALALGRMLRTAMICDDARPRNKSAIFLNNFPTQDGVTPAEWRDQARKNLEKYQSIHFFSGTVDKLIRLEDTFEAILLNGSKHFFRKILLAFGHQDRLPEIPGFKELWGTSVFQCPYCHGFEFRNKALGIFANGEAAFQAAIMISALTKDVAIFTNGESTLDFKQKETLKRNNMSLYEQKISRLKYSENKLHSVVFDDESCVHRDALVVTPVFPLQPKSNFAMDLGCETTELGAIKIDDRGRTSVLGVYAAGDMIDALKQTVLIACASGQTAAFGVVYDLLAEDFNGKDENRNV